MEKQTGGVSANVLGAGVIISIISLVIAVCALGVNYYNATYPGNTDTGKSFTYKLKSGQNSVVRIEPCKGKLYFGYIQKSGSISGNSRSSYRSYYRPGTSATWRTTNKFVDGKRTTQALVSTPSKNNKSYGRYLISSVNGKDSYLFKWAKVTGKKASAGTVDLMID